MNVNLTPDVAVLSKVLTPAQLSDARIILTWLRGNKIDWAARFFVGSLKNGNFKEFKTFARLNGKRINNTGKPEMNEAINRLRRSILGKADLSGVSGVYSYDACVNALSLLLKRYNNFKTRVSRAKTMSGEDIHELWAELYKFKKHATEQGRYISYASSSKGGKWRDIGRSNEILQSNIADMFWTVEDYCNRADS